MKIWRFDFLAGIELSRNRIISLSVYHDFNATLLEKDYWVAMYTAFEHSAADFLL